MDAAREEILKKLRVALQHEAITQMPSLPPSARVRPRSAGNVEAEIDLLLSEIDKLGGATKRLAGKDELSEALAELVKTETIQKATVWATPELQELGVSNSLAALGVEIISPHADKRQIAACDLGVTGVDCALPETGTLLLRSSPEQPRLVSLLPRVHLAIVRPTALRPDLHQALAEVKGERYLVFISGPSRTADIELTLAIGVHGPKALAAWVLA